MHIVSARQRSINNNFDYHIGQTKFPVVDLCLCTCFTCVVSQIKLDWIGCYVMFVVVRFFDMPTHLSKTRITACLLTEIIKQFFQLQQVTDRLHCTPIHLHHFNLILPR